MVLLASCASRAPVPVVTPTPEVSIRADPSASTTPAPAEVQQPTSTTEGTPGSTTTSTVAPEGPAVPGAVSAEEPAVAVPSQPPTPAAPEPVIEPAEPPVAIVPLPPAPEPVLPAPAPAAAMSETELLAVLTPPKASVASPKALPTAVPQSAARNALAYRVDGARHIYRKFPDRIFNGKLPRMVLAIGVVHIDIDAHGEVAAFQWARTPKNSPRVALEIEQLVRAAAPYPAPVHLGSVSYTETWLWDKSGRFQLDTLTQGQD